MNFNPEMGEVYDTLFGITMCSYENVFLTRLRSRFGEIDIEAAMRGFYDFKERHKSFVQRSETEPFIYTDYSLGLFSFLINVIRDNLSLEEHTKDGVISFLQNRDIKRLFWEHIFKKDLSIAERIITNDSTLNVFNLISKLDMTENMKLRLIDMTHDFPKYQRKLVETVRETYPLVVKYRSENQSVIDEIKSQINDDLLDRLHNIYKLPENLSATSISFSLLNGLQLDYRIRNKKICFVFGKHFIDVIDALHRYDHISFYSVGQASYVKTRSQMIDMFFNYKSLCASEIAHNLKVTSSNVYNHLNFLLLEGMIKYTNSAPKYNGEKVYYSINPDYFKAFVEFAADVNQRAHDNVLKGIEKYDLPRKKRKARDGLIYNDNDEYDEEEVD